MQCFIPRLFIFNYNCFFCSETQYSLERLSCMVPMLQKSHAVTILSGQGSFCSSSIFLLKVELNDGLSHESHHRRVTLYLPLMRQCDIFLFTCTCQSSHTCAYTTAAGLAPFAFLTLLLAARPLDPCCRLQSQAVQALPPL